jgi:acyl-coenzyme A synthetase/AMP-(fatty) acid ligase
VTVTVTASVDAHVAAQPDGSALIEVGARPLALGWAEFADQADRLSAALLALGVGAGDRVAFQLPNWAECAVVSLAVLQIGAVVAPVMPVFGPRESALVLARSAARVLILPESFRGRAHAAELSAVRREADARGLPLALEHVIVVAAHDSAGHLRDGATPAGPSTRPEAPSQGSQRAVRDGSAVDEGATLPSSRPEAPVQESQRAVRDGSVVDEGARGGVGAGVAVHDYDGLLARAPEPQERAAVRARRPGGDDVAQLLFTSGTTGEPKGVLHSHRTLALATAMEAEHLALTSEDRVFIPSPLAHQTGFLYGLLLSWHLGAAAVVQPVWNPSVALDQAFGRAHARFMQAATPFVMDLVQAVDGGARAPESLRIVVPTGAAVPRELAARAVEVLGTAVCGAFGTTETCLGTLSAPGDAPASAWGSDGRPLPGIRVRIVDDEGAELPSGAEGHFELHSPTTFLGYLDRPDLTAEAFTADGWYRTGDLAVLDADGYLHLTGRVKDVVNRGGEKVPVVEIENLLFGHPSVNDVAIVAEPHPRLGERACAFVVTAHAQPDLDLRGMQKHLAAAGVSKYYWPERLVLIERLPRNAVGKIQKNVLRDEAAGLVLAEQKEQPE